MALIKCPECNLEISDKASQCIKCGFPISAEGNSSLAAASEHPIGNSSADTSRVPCPNCSELVKPTATLCPFCKQAILSRSKGKNAFGTLIMSVVLFYVIFQALQWFIFNEAEEETARIMRESQQQTEEMLRDLREQQ